ncbi:MAG: SapC family protein [Gammaproteobacteria bacterium]
MTSMTLLDSVKHADMHLLPGGGVTFAGKQHILPIRAEEISKAVCDFPVFMTRNTNTGAWSFSLVASLMVENNLFVEDSKWTATYVPQVIETHPFYLTPTDQDDQYALAIDESSDALSRSEGEALFDENGKSSPWLESLTKKMQSQLQSNQQTLLFIKAIEDAELVKEIGVQVVFDDETVQTINGLHTIDEEKLQALDSETLTDFNKRGYLQPLNGMLLSVFQLNSLIRRHNRLVETTEGQKVIRQIKLEVARDAGATT